MFRLHMSSQVPAPILVTLHIAVMKPHLPLPLCRRDRCLHDLADVRYAGMILRFDLNGVTLSENNSGSRENHDSPCMLAIPQHQKSLREIPSFCIMAFNVVRGTPRRVAAALITPPVSWRTWTIYSRSISARVPPAASACSVL